MVVDGERERVEARVIEEKERKAIKDIVRIKSDLSTLVFFIGRFLFNTEIGYELIIV